MSLFCDFLDPPGTLLAPLGAAGHPNGPKCVRSLRGQKTVEIETLKEQTTNAQVATKCAPLGPPWVSLGTPWVPLRSPWVPLGSPLGPLWVPFGSSLASPWGLLGSMVFCCSPGTQGGPKGHPLRSPLGPPWVPLRPSLGPP